MKKIFLLGIISILSCNIFADIKKDSILVSLYEMIGQKNLYMQQKEEHIDDIKKYLKTPNVTPEQLYDINLKLYNEYKTYLSDSAIHYARENMRIAETLGRHEWISESKLALSSLYSVAGMYLESSELLKSIDRKSLPDWQLTTYYNSYKQLYEYYAYNNMYTNQYFKIAALYRDSLLMHLDPQSDHYKIVYAEKLADNGEYEAARQRLLTLYNQSDEEDHRHAVLAYAIARVFQREGNNDKQIRYFAISAIADMKNAIMENASMQALAIALYESGDIDHAYMCIKSSMEDAMFCNARLRSYEVSKIFPIIDSAYQEKTNKQKHDLVLSLIFISILTLFLAVAVVYVYKQMKRLSRIRKELYRTNVKLNELNTDLQSSNKQLKDLNLELSEANKIKETYIGHFLDLCSMYISKLEKYQNTLNKKAVEKKLDELYKMLKSHDMIDNELKELFENFDNIFLHLYPNFVEEFNLLIAEEERFVLKNNELLNTELRIFALIRLGITDSSKIANFLHYSANTIYNYRTRVRNKAAVPREEFESFVMKIGAITK